MVLEDVVVVLVVLPVPVDVDVVVPPPVPVEDRVSAGVEMTGTVGDTDGEVVEPGGTMHDPLEQV